MKKTVAALTLLLAAAPARAQTLIKFATLAPEGSTWMKVMHDMDAELRDKTGGRVGFRFYAGGVSGDENDVLRKIRIGQLHAGGVTGIGLGIVTPTVRLLDAPFLIASGAQFDAVTTAFDGEFRKAFEDKGFVLLGWAEVGPVYVFSASPVRSVADLRKQKAWMWEGDPIAQALYKTLDVSPVPLSIADVRSSLETGLINTVYGSPMAMLALQWYQRTGYRLSVPITYASGAVLMSKKQFDALSADDQKTLLAVSQSQLRRLTELTRKENEQALKTLAAHGVKTVEPASEAETGALRAAGLKARQDLAGVLYPKEYLERAEKVVADASAKAAAR